MSIFWIIWVYKQSFCYFSKLFSVWKLSNGTFCTLIFFLIHCYIICLPYTPQIFCNGRWSSWSTRNWWGTLWWWCKTKEMVVDFQMKKTVTMPTNIMGQEVETGDKYRYSGVHLNDWLDLRTNSDAMYKKRISRLYFLRELRSFDVCSKMLEIFYQSVAVRAYILLLTSGGSASVPQMPAGSTN